MKEIPLSQGKVALVDDEDYEVLHLSKWCAQRSRSGITFYAERSIYHPGGRWTHEKMHRFVLAWALDRELIKGEKVDHRNGDGLDNQRSNLRVATNAQNLRNCYRHAANASSRFLGVSWHKANGKWTAQIGVNGKKVYLGIHATEMAAAQAREAYIAARPELMARSNFQNPERTQSP